MDKWAEVIVWQEYPKHKPEKDGEYLVVFRKGLYQQHSTSFYYCNDDTWEWALDGEIVAFAELPTGNIGKEFGFETAVLLMKEGICVESLVSYNQHWIQKYDDDDIWISSVSDNGEFLPCEILGKWRLA